MCAEAETQVRERTAELRIANEILTKEIVDRRLTEHRLHAQHAITKVLAEAPDPETAITTILQILCKNLDRDWAAVWMLDSANQRLSLIQFSHSNSANIDEFHIGSREMTFARGEGLPGRVWASAPSGLGARYYRRPGAEP